MVKEYTDKYFIRTREILEKEGLNPNVKAQVFVRKGPGRIKGIDEAIEHIAKYTNHTKVFARTDGELYLPGDVLMKLEGPIQDFVELETTYLGILSHNLTLENDGYQANLAEIEKRATEIVKEAQGRPVLYMGARHYHMNNDAEIAAATFRGGFVGTSTDIGAKVLGQKGIGTIPHILENMMAYVYGKERAVVEATKAFDRWMTKDIPRIALIDYNNREIEDTITTAREVPTLKAARVDTCGENMAQGAFQNREDFERALGRRIDIPQEDEKYWFGNGVTISGVYTLRNALNQAGYQKVEILLTSGFANPEKVRAFVRAENRLETRLFDGLGCGQIVPSRATKTDVYEVEGKTLSKAGRKEIIANNLVRRL